MTESINHGRGILFATTPFVLGATAIFVGGTAKHNVENGIGNPVLSHEAAEILLWSGVGALVLSVVAYFATRK